MVSNPPFFQDRTQFQRIPIGLVGLLGLQVAAGAFGLANERMFGEIVASEFFVEPVAEGWLIAQHFCEPKFWTTGGWHYQELSMAGCQGSEAGARDAYTRSIQAFNGVAAWYVQHRVFATGSSSEIPGGAPTVLATGNAFGNLYHATLASDQIKLSGDGDLPVIFLDVEPGISHTIRLELYNEPLPATFHWYVDGALVLEGLADSSFPDFDSRITWQGRSWMQPTLNAWDYIRFGDIPEDGSGDFDGEGDVDLRDFFYLHECLTNAGPGLFGGPGGNAGPGCRWADFDADGDVDLVDFRSFQSIFGLHE